MHSDSEREASCRRWRSCARPNRPAWRKPRRKPGGRSRDPSHSAPSHPPPLPPYTPTPTPTKATSAHKAQRKAAQRRTLPRAERRKTCAQQAARATAQTTTSLRKKGCTLKLPLGRGGSRHRRSYQWRCASRFRRGCTARRSGSSKRHAYAQAQVIRRHRKTQEKGRPPPPRQRP